MWFSVAEDCFLVETNVESVHFWLMPGQCGVGTPASNHKLDPAKSRSFTDADSPTLSSLDACLGRGRGAPTNTWVFFRTGVVQQTLDCTMQGHQVGPGIVYSFPRLIAGTTFVNN